MKQSLAPRNLEEALESIQAEDSMAAAELEQRQRTFVREAVIETLGQESFVEANGMIVLKFDHRGHHLYGIIAVKGKDARACEYYASLLIGGAPLSPGLADRLYLENEELRHSYFVHDDDAVLHNMEVSIDGIPTREEFSGLIRMSFECVIEKAIDLIEDLHLSPASGPLERLMCQS